MPNEEVSAEALEIFPTLVDLIPVLDDLLALLNIAGPQVAKQRKSLVHEPLFRQVLEARAVRLPKKPDAAASKVMFQLEMKGLILVHYGPDDIPEAKIPTTRAEQAHTEAMTLYHAIYDAVSLSG